MTYDSPTPDTKVRWADPSAIEQALALLRSGEVVAFPTDTVYGVGADCLEAAAIEKLFEAKLRPRGKPIALLAGSAGDVTGVVAKWPRAAETLARRFWPGGLTIVVQADAVLPSVLTAGSGKIGIRVPDHAATKALIGGLGRPIAATSANLSGQASLTTASEVAAALSGRIRLVLDGGRCSGGVESTVIDVTTDTPTILRFGAISTERIAEALGVWPIVA